jgi:hypothetical protein
VPWAPEVSGLYLEVVGERELNPWGRDDALSLDPTDGVAAHADHAAELLRRQPLVDTPRSEFLCREMISVHAK